MVEEAEWQIKIESRLKALEDKVGDIDAFGFQEQILQLEQRSLKLERYVIGARILIDCSNRYFILSLLSQFDRISHPILEEAVSAIGKRVAKAQGQLENADDPTKAFSEYYRAMEGDFERLGLDKPPPIESGFPSPFR